MDIQVGDILKLKKQHPCGSPLITFEGDSLSFAQDG